MKSFSSCGFSFLRFVSSFLVALWCVGCVLSRIWRFFSAWMMLALWIHIVVLFVFLFLVSSFFLEKDMMTLLREILQQKTENSVKRQLIQTLCILVQNLERETSLCLFLAKSFILQIFVLEEEEGAERAQGGCLGSFFLSALLCSCLMFGNENPRVSTHHRG